MGHSSLRVTCEALLSRGPVSNVLSAKEKLPESGSVVKNLPANAGDLGSIPASGRSPGEGNGNPPQCSCLENSMDRGAWRATAYAVTQSWTRLSADAHTHRLQGVSKPPLADAAARTHSRAHTCHTCSPRTAPVCA